MFFIYFITDPWLWDKPYTQVNLSAILISLDHVNLFTELTHNFFVSMFLSTSDLIFLYFDMFCIRVLSLLCPDS